MRERLLHLRGELGLMGAASIGLLMAAAMFFVLVLQPMKDQQQLIESALARAGRSASQPGEVSGNLATFYSFLDKQEANTDWLAKLYGIGKATGVEMKSASYRTQKAGERLERYEIVLPVAGSYAQIRDFLKRALAEIPVLSLDQMTLKRETRNDGAVQAELRLTIHRVKPS
jgi:type II secretion system (T2SS) protein M